MGIAQSFIGTEPALRNFFYSKINQPRECNWKQDETEPNNSGELKTSCGHLKPMQRHLYNGLARRADYSIFARKWTRSH